MKSLVAVFWNICLLRDGPERVPTASWFVGAVVLADVATSLALISAVQPQASPVDVANRVLVGLAVTAGITYLALYLRDLRERFPATFTALLGCELLINVLLALAFGITRMLPEAAFTVTALVMFVWSITVSGWVLHRSLDLPLLAGILIAFFIFIFATTLGNVAAAPPSAATP